jgi:hypothetical protein
MSRFCKTCKFLKADREKQLAECTFWVDFAKRFPMPFSRISSPIFRPTVVLPRHIWNDLPVAPDIAKTSADMTADWTEFMDCPQWIAK